MCQRLYSRSKKMSVSNLFLRFLSLIGIISLHSSICYSLGPDEFSKALSFKIACGKGSGHSIEYAGQNISTPHFNEAGDEPFTFGITRPKIKSKWNASLVSTHGDGTEQVLDKVSWPIFHILER